MSVKIYRGYKVNHKNMRKVLDWVHEIRAGFLDAKCEYLLDMHPDLGLSGQSEKAFALWKEINRQVNEAEKSNRWDPYGLKAELVFYPLEDYTLCTTVWQIKSYTNYWEALTDVSYYGYWNNSDEDEDCSEEEWQQRKEDWGSVILDSKYSGVPSECGFTIQVSPYRIPFRQEFVDYNERKSTRLKPLQAS